MSILYFLFGGMNMSINKSYEINKGGDNES
jgi:hypothetical protein